MYYNSNNGQLIGYTIRKVKLPDGTTVSGAPTEAQLIAAGIYPYVEATHDPTTQKRGDIQVVNDIASEEVIDLDATELTELDTKTKTRELRLLYNEFAAKGLVWYFKRELQAGRLTAQELPNALVTAYQRIQELETELGV